MKKEIMSVAGITEKFNLVGCWNRNSVYKACNMSWNGIDREEEELLQDVEKTVGSAEFLVPLNVSGTGEPLPLTALTVEQLIMVAEYDPPGEKRAIRRTLEDKEEYMRLVDDSTKKSKENTPNSTKELVDWMYKKFVKAIADGVIRTITVVNIRGVKFHLLPKRGIWSKGSNNEVGQKQTQEEAVLMEKRATQDEENTVEHTNNAKRLRVTREEHRESESEREPNHTTQNMELSDSEEEWVRRPKEKTSGTGEYTKRYPPPFYIPPPPPQP